MTTPELPGDAPGTALFPQFERQLYEMITIEIEGLSDAQLDFESDQWEWSKWSIRRNLSHMASGDFRWFLLRWGEQLFPEGLPEVDYLDGIANSPHDRRLDEDKYWNVPDILEKLRQGLEVSHLVLRRETVASMQARETKSANTGDWPRFYQAHPRGVRTDPEDASQVYITLEASFRHRYFEHITHLYNIQRLKRAQGLTAKIELPFEGYMALPDWDRSEP